MKWPKFLKFLGISLLLASCSNSPTQKPPTDLRQLTDNPQGLFIQIMNYMLPMEMDGITMEKVSAEGENGVIFPMVGDIPIPNDLDEMQTEMFNKIFSGMARDQVCNQGSEAMFQKGLYVKFVFRDEKSKNQVEVIVDEETCRNDGTETTNAGAKGPFSKSYIQCFAEPLIEEGQFKDTCARIGQASYHFTNEDDISINWGGFNDFFYEDGSRAWSQKFENTSFSTSDRMFRGSIIFDKKLSEKPDELRWDFEMIFNEDYSKITNGTIQAITENGAKPASFFSYDDRKNSDRTNDWWYVRYD